MDAIPSHLLVDIFRRLGATAVIRCAAVCRPWRRTIIDNASFLKPRPDCFHPNILLGFFDKDMHLGRSLPCQLKCVPAFNNDTTATAGVYVDGKLSSELLSSRDGFLLLGEDEGTGDHLCLYVLATGTYSFLPIAGFTDHSVRCMYVLATGYDFIDDDDNDDEKAVWISILAVHCLRDSKDGMIYQIFSSRSGTWGPVKRSAKFPMDVAHVFTDPHSPKGAMVVFHGTVSWFIHLYPDPNNAPNRRIRKCIFSIDLRTERTWTTELPESLITEINSVVLAVSEDGRQLSLVSMLSISHNMEVWELVDGRGRWTRRRTIDDVHKLLPRSPGMWGMRLSGFCPRSAYLFGSIEDNRGPQHHFVIGVDGSSPRMIGAAVQFSSSDIRSPYEMDWSTYISPYISKMKYF